MVEVPSSSAWAAALVAQSKCIGSCIKNLQFDETKKVSQNLHFETESK